MQKIAEFKLKKDFDESMLNPIVNKTSCELQFIDMPNGKKLEIYGDNSCRASLKKMKII